MIKKIVVIAAALMLVSTPAVAAPRLAFEAAPVDGGTVRFDKGIPSLDIQRTRGAVQVIPRGLSNGRLAFSIAVLNTGMEPDNFGVEDISVRVGGAPVGVLSMEDLQRQARNRARRAQFAVALASALSGAAAASSRDHYTATTYTPRGTYRTHISTPSVSGQIAAHNIARDGAYTNAAIQNQLDNTRAYLADEIIQTTTVDPEDSYGGTFVLHQLRGPQARWPQTVTITVTFNGEEYPFTYTVTRATRQRRRS